MDKWKEISAGDVTICEWEYRYRIKSVANTAMAVMIPSFELFLIK